LVVAVAAAEEWAEVGMAAEWEVGWEVVECTGVEWEVGCMRVE
jgi:hypothetical protein